MGEKGIRVQTELSVKSIEKTGAGFLVVAHNEAEFEADLVLYATGRRPNTGGLGLERAGVKLDAAGAVIVDEYSCSTCPSIHAVGDVTNRMNLTPVAIREGAAVAETLFNDNPTTVDYRDVPTAVFSQPAVGAVGLTESEARALHGDDAIDIYKAYFRGLKHTLTGRQEHMLMKLVVHGVTDRVLGVHLIGPEAPELIQLAAVAVKAGVTKSGFDETVAVHPSAAEEMVTLREKYMPPESELTPGPRRAAP
jgi:glutathione reductase (NADPH)